MCPADGLLSDREAASAVPIEQCREGPAGPFTGCVRQDRNLQALTGSDGPAGAGRGDTDGPARQGRRVPQESTGRSGDGLDVHSVPSGPARAAMLPVADTVTPGNRAVRQDVLRAGFAKGTGERGSPGSGEPATLRT